MDDNLLQDIQQLIQVREIPTQDEEEVRKLIKNLKLNENSIKTLTQIQPQHQINNEKVFLRVQIIDIYDSSLYVGAEINDNSITIYPFRGSAKQSNNQLYFDRHHVKVQVLDPTRAYQKTQKTYDMLIYTEEQPKIFEVVNVIGYVEDIQEALFIHAIGFVKQEIKVDLQQEYNNFISQLNNLFEDQNVSEIVSLYLFLWVSHKIYDQGGRQILNLYGLDQENAENIKRFLSHIYSPTLQVSLANEFLAKSTTLSKKNIDTNHLELGYLNVPTNIQSVVVVDETQLKEGKLEGSQVQNLQNINNFINFSKIGIDYTFNIVDIPVQTSVIILSKGKSFLPATIHVQAKLKKQDIQQEWQNFDGLIQHIHNIKVNISEEIKQQINAIYVEMRKVSDKITPEHLNLWIILAKVIAAVEGQQEVQLKHFEKAQQLRSL
ncbi:hypothetical protein pb186bvf_020493 [Paramecium bursaria]